MKNTLLSSRIFACALLLAMPSRVLFAQAPAAATNDLIKLEDFNVSADRASGYRAQNSITATGFGAKILDVPVTINVLTSEFVSDLGVSLQSEALRYVPGVNTNPNYESYINIRGFAGLQSYRNGQYRRQLYSTWGMDRIEVIKGSSSIFFGLVRPGGVSAGHGMAPEVCGALSRAGGHGPPTGRLDRIVPATFTPWRR